jgi:hypothetical protein
MEHLLPPDPPPPLRASARRGATPTRCCAPRTCLATAPYARPWTLTGAGGRPRTPVVAERLRPVAERLRLDSDPPRNRRVRQNMDFHGCREEPPRTPRRRGATPPVGERLRLVAGGLRLDSDPPRTRLVRQTLDSHGCRRETPRTPRRRGATPPGRPAVAERLRLNRRCAQLLRSSGKRETDSVICQFRSV